jgi:hypothetical protein
MRGSSPSVTTKRLGFVSLRFVAKVLRFGERGRCARAMAFEGRPAALGPHVGSARRAGPRLRPDEGARGANGALSGEFEDRTRRVRLQSRSGTRGVALGFARFDSLPSPRQRGRGAARGARGFVERCLKAVGKRAHTSRIATREATGKGEGAPL